MKSQQQKFTAVLYGGMNSYKTKLRKTICNQQYKLSDQVILGFDKSSTSIQHKQRILRANIIDTQQIYGIKKGKMILALTPLDRCDCIIFVVEISTRQTFNSAVEFYAKQIRTGYSDKVIMIVENIVQPNKRAVSQKEIMNFAKQNGMMFHQINDGSKMMIEEMFKRIADQLELRQKLRLQQAKRQADRQKRQKIERIQRLMESILAKNYWSYQTKQSLKITQREKILLEEVIRLIRLQQKANYFDQLHNENAEKLKTYQAKVKEMQTKISELQVFGKIDFYQVLTQAEKQKVRSSQEFKHIYVQLKENMQTTSIRCRTLEQICNLHDGITLMNVSTRFCEISQAYQSYRKKYLSNERILVTERQLSQASNQSSQQRLSNPPIVRFT